MGKSVQEFREFIKDYPKIKQEVQEGKTKWQNVYEDWVILGPEDAKWSNYKSETVSPFDTSSTSNNAFENSPFNNVKKEGQTQSETKKDAPSKFNMAQTSELVKSAYGYIKKVNTDQVVKTLSNAQKVMGLVQGFIGGGMAGAGLGALKKSTGDPLFDKKFDEWY